MAGRFGHAAARVIDTTAMALYQAGTRVAGERGGDVADGVASAVLGRARLLLPDGCHVKNCPDPQCPDKEA